MICWKYFYIQIINYVQTWVKYGVPNLTLNIVFIFYINLFRFFKCVFFLLQKWTSESQFDNVHIVYEAWR